MTNETRWSLRIEKKVLAVVALALLGRFVLLVIQVSNPVFSTVGISEYAPTFHETATAIAQIEFLSQIKPHLPFYSLLYPGWLFYLFGEDGLILVRVANVFLSLLIVFPMNWLHKRLFDAPVAPWQVALVLFWPTYLRFSVSVDRTVVSVLTIIAAVVFILGYLDDRSPVLFVVVLTAIVAIMLRTQYLAYIFMFILCVYLYKSKRSPPSVRRMVGGMVIIFGFLFYQLYEYLEPYGIDLPAAIIETAKYTARGGSAYLVHLYPQQWLDYLWYLPLHAFYFAFSPMPWDVWEIHRLSAVISMLLAWSLLGLTLYVLIRHHRYIISDWQTGSLLGTIALVAVGFGAAVKNAGGAVRWRLPSTLLLLVILTGIVYMTRRKESEKA